VMKNLFIHLSAFLLCSIMGSCVTQSPTTTLPPEPEPLDAVLEDRIREVITCWDLLLDKDFDPWPCAGSIRNSNGGLIGSGVLIGPCHVLTAAHVADHDGPMFFREYDDDEIEVAAVEYHPDYTEDGKYLDDIAILHLTRESDEEPMTWLFGDNETDNIRSWKPVLVLGYSFDLRKVSEPFVFRYYGRLFERPRTVVMIPNEATIWNGDSGGPMFTGDGCLLGIVVSYRMSNDKPIENNCSSIEYYHDWIRQIVPHE